MHEPSAGSGDLWKKVGVAALVGVLAVAAGFWARRSLAPRASEAAGGVSEGAVELSFALAALDGGKVAARDFSGRVLVVDFWATWCGPCRVQEEILSRLHERYSSDPVSFLAINVGESEDLVRKFVEKDPFAYPVLMDPAQTLSAKYGIYALPTVMVLDRRQGILFQNMGISSAGQVGSAIDRALGSG